MIVFSSIKTTTSTGTRWIHPTDEETIWIILCSSVLCLNLSTKVGFNHILEIIYNEVTEGPKPTCIDTCPCNGYFDTLGLHAFLYGHATHASITCNIANPVYGEGSAFVSNYM